MAQDGRIQKLVAWWVLGLTVFVDTIWFLTSDCEFLISGTFKVLLGIVAIGVVLAFYSIVRRDERIVAALYSVLVLIGFTSAAATFSYLIASLSFPLWDAEFHRWDMAFGLDWRAYLAWLNDHPAIGFAFTLAYQSIMPQIIIICVVLGLTGRCFELSVFILAFFLSCMLCVLISGVMPAMGMYVHLGLKPTDFPNLSPAAAYLHVEHMLALRDGTYHSFNLTAAQGIITFPSFHASLAVIFLRAFWSIPWLRWPSVVLNLVMIAATPIDGGHYFVDVGAGIVIAVACLVFAENPKCFLSLRRGIGSFPVLRSLRYARSWGT